MPLSHRRTLIRRARHILRGPIEVTSAAVSLLILLSGPVMDYLLDLWEGLPWWVGLLLLVVLISYALVRAGYELWKEEEAGRQKVEATLQESEQEHGRLEAALQQSKQQQEVLRAEEEQLRTRLQNVKEERDALWEENEGIIAELEAKKGQLNGLPQRQLGSSESDIAWGKIPTQAVFGKTFKNEKIELDGFSYSKCVFINPTFVYRGENPFDWVDNTIEGRVRIQLDSPQLNNIAMLLEELDYFSPRINRNELPSWRPDPPD